MHRLHLPTNVKGFVTESIPGFRLRIAAKNWQRGMTKLEVSLIFRCFRATIFLNGKESTGLLEVISRDIRSMDLNPLELEVLRYLYGPRKAKDVITNFKMKSSDKAINEILDNHLRLGSIIRHKNKLMSIFHDPGYLQTI